MTDKNPRYGHVAVFGLPNAGKSTLVNTLVGEKVSIVTPKVQTTRNRITAILTEGRAQIVLIDTPGIFEGRNQFDAQMSEAAWQSVEDCDYALLIVDAAGQDPLERHEKLLKRLPRNKSTRIALVLNKIDKLEKERVLSLISAFTALYPFADVFPLSARKAGDVHDLKKTIAMQIPEGPWAYDEDQISTLPQRFLAAEITREKIFLQTFAEIPYAIAVETELWEERDDNSLFLQQVIYVDKEKLKSILLGARGQKIKTIGQSSRIEMAKIYGRPVHLKLFVKVNPKWRDDPQFFPNRYA
ncbi:MAG: GTPase Era [Alphaproteobacteria bacterium]|nr:GTPase Era [Alphaproteobacteria bacterium]